MTTSSAAQHAAPRSSEPSMEEILASIRKIISDDQRSLEAGKAAPKPAEPPPADPAPPAAEDDEEDVLDLELATEAPPAPVPPPLAPRPVIAPEPRAFAPEPPPAPAPVEPPRLISDQAAGAASQAFQSLANTVLSQNARTIDDLVKEMLRPMLKSWLDENLPGMVERLVRAEIERVARGGR